MRRFEKNTIYWGLVVGLVSPLIGFLLVFGIFSLLLHNGILEPAASGWSDKRMRTIFLLSICTNVFWIRKFNRPFLTKSLRGVVMATMIYCSIWFLMYYRDLYAE